MLNQQLCAQERRQHRLGQMRTTAIVLGAICALIIIVLASLVGVIGWRHWLASLVGVIGWRRDRAACDPAIKGIGEA